MKTEANPRFFGTVCYPRLDRNDETRRLQRQRWKRGELGWVKAAEQMVGAAIQLVADKSLTCPILSTGGTGVSGPQGRFAWLLRRYRKSAVTSRSLGSRLLISSLIATAVVRVCRLHLGASGRFCSRILCHRIGGSGFSWGDQSRLSRRDLFPPVDGFAVRGQLIEEVGDELDVCSAAAGPAELP
jgi:hypothetical protein